MKKISVLLATLLALSSITNPTLASQKLQKAVVVNEMKEQNNLDPSDSVSIEKIKITSLKDSLTVPTIYNVAFHKKNEIEGFKGTLVHRVVLNSYSEGSFWQLNDYTYDIAWFENTEYATDVEITSSSVQPFNGAQWPTQAVHVDALYKITLSADPNIAQSKQQDLFDLKFNYAGYDEEKECDKYTQVGRLSYIIGKPNPKLGL